MTEPRSISALAALLRQGGASLAASERTVGPSSLYDFSYRAYVVAAAFEALATPHLGGRRVLAARLKFVQFLATRSWLLPVARNWEEDSDWPRLRLAYLADRTYDAMLLYLTAARVLRVSKAHVVEDERAHHLAVWAAELEQSNLLAGERAAIATLSGAKAVTRRMLGVPT